MKRFTLTGATALKGILQRDGFEMIAIEYPHLFTLAASDGSQILINIRGKHHASWWMLGRREEFGIPAVEFATHSETARDLGVPLYFFFYEERSKTISFISSNNTLIHARVWEKDNVDVGGTLFVPKKNVTPIARLLDDGQMQYFNHFVPEKQVAPAVI